MRQNARNMVLGLLALSLLGLLGCELFEGDAALDANAPGSAEQMSSLIVGDAEISDWGAQYTEGNTYAMVNIPVAGALRVRYVVAGGATFAVFMETTKPTKWEIGLYAYADGTVVTLESVTVTYQEGAVFARVPDGAVAHEGNGWKQYQRAGANGDAENVWPVGAAFEFGGATRSVTVVTGGAASSPGVSGPFDKTPEVVPSVVPAPTAHEVRLWVAATVSAGDLGGVEGANDICKADTARPGGMWTGVLAVLSDSSQDARDVLPPEWRNVVVKRGDGSVVVANGWEELFSGNPLKAVISEDVDKFPWTGTFPDGTKAVGNTCKDWTTSDIGYDGAYGDASSNKTDGGGWLSWYHTSTCDDETGGSIYCVSYR